MTRTQAKHQLVEVHTRRDKNGRLIDFVVPVIGSYYLLCHTDYSRKTAVLQDYWSYNNPQFGRTFQCPSHFVTMVEYFELGTGI